MKERIAIVIPFFNNASFTISCVNSIVHDIDDSLRNNIKFYFVDDGSNFVEEKKIVSFSETLNFDYKYIKGDGSWWWAKSLSIGMKAAVFDEYDIILMMNNDNIFEKGSFKNLVRIFLENNLDILGSLVKFKDNRVKHFGVSFDHYSGKIVHNHLNDDVNLVDCNSLFLNTDSLGGQGVLISKNALKKLNYLDYNVFPQYGSDLDFYLRANSLGIKVCVTRWSVIIDDEESTGLIKSHAKLSVSDFFNSLISIKSHMKLSVKYNVYKRHVKGYYLFWLFLLYVKYAIKFALRMI